MEQNAAPLLGVIEAPDLAYALTLLGFNAVGEGAPFREAASAIRNSGQLFSVFMADVKGPGIRTWVDRSVSLGASVVVLGTMPSGGAIPVTTGTHAPLPSTINQLLAYAGYGATPHPLGDAELLPDGSIPALAQYRALPAPTPAAIVEPEPEPELALAPAPVVEQRPAPALVAPTAATEPAPVSDEFDDAPSWALSAHGLSTAAPVTPEQVAPAELPVIAVPDTLGDFPEPLSGDQESETAAVGTAPVETVAVQPQTAPVEVAPTLPEPAAAAPVFADEDDDVDEELVLPTPVSVKSHLAWSSHTELVPAEETPVEVAAPAPAVSLPAPAVPEPQPFDTLITPAVAEDLFTPPAEGLFEVPAAAPQVFQPEPAVTPAADLFTAPAEGLFEVPAAPQVFLPEPAITAEPALPEAVAAPTPAFDFFAPAGDPFSGQPLVEAPAPAPVAPLVPQPTSDWFSSSPADFFGPAEPAAAPQPVFIPEPVAAPQPAFEAPQPVFVPEPVVAPQPVSAPVPLAVAPQPAPVTPAYTSVVAPQPLEAATPAPVSPAAVVAYQPPVVTPQLQADGYPAPVFGGVGRDGKLIISVAGKGGVGKTTSALMLAERAGAAGLRVIAVDGNRGQGDIRKYLRVESMRLPSIYNAAISGRIEDALISPDELNANRPPNLPPLNFGVILAPPPSLADPSVVTSSVYAHAVAFAQEHADLVIFDTQIAEAADTSGMIDNLVVPALARGAWAYAVADNSRPGVHNLLERVRDFAARGVDRRHVLLVMNKADEFTEADRTATETLFDEFATVIGGIGEDASIKDAMNRGEIDVDNHTVRPVIDAALRLVTGNTVFDPAATRAKKRFSLFGRGR